MRNCSALAGRRSDEATTLASPQERADQKRREKLAQIREQLASGALTIRQMTPAERAKHPPRPHPPKRKRW
jgi:hypothetical protein